MNLVELAKKMMTKCNAIGKKQVGIIVILDDMDGTCITVSNFPKQDEAYATMMIAANDLAARIATRDIPYDESFPLNRT